MVFDQLALVSQAVLEAPVQYRVQVPGAAVAVGAGLHSNSQVSMAPRKSSPDPIARMLCPPPHDSMS